MGIEEILTDFKSLTRTRRLNGDKIISLTTFPTAKNKHAFDLLGEESTVTLDGENYIIKKHQKRTIGNTYFKQSEGVKDFFVKLINSQQPNIHNGSMTFAAACQFVLGGLYTFNIIDSFTAQSFENFGNDNRLALFQKIVERYGAEFTVSNNVVTFRKMIGNDTDFQFRYGHNIKSIEENIDTSNLATVIRGKGANGITAYYRSPNADIFGEIDAPPVEDERFTTQESLLAEMKARLQDTPEISTTIDFVDLRASGYPYTVPNEGDRIFTIYEPMDNLLTELRIVEIAEVLDINLKPVDTKVTLSNYKKTFSKTMLSAVQKELRKITNEDGVIKYNVLDEAVKIATEAIKSAQTELSFENGIIARDKDNPNLLVAFNSGGVGISTDAGQTFRQAITSNGVVTDVLTAGQINTNNISIVGGDGNRFTRLDSEGFESTGAVRIRRPDGYVVVNDGIMQNGFDITGAVPPFMSGLVSVQGWFFKTIQTNPQDCQYYSFKHDCRYLKVQVSMYSEVPGSGVRMAVFDNPGNLLAGAVRYENTDGGATLTVDLGVPTGDIKSVYVRMNTGVANSHAFGRIIRAWKEG